MKPHVRGRVERSGTRLALRPRRVRIGHLQYEVEWDQATIDQAGQDSNVHYAGFSNINDALIAVSPFMAPDAEAETLLHEVLHQCLRSSYVDPDDDAKAGVGNVEERTVGAIAGSLLAVLRDNPELVDYLLHRESPNAS